MAAVQRHALGFREPVGVLGAVVDEDGRVWFYRELYQAGVGESDQAQRILSADAEDEHVSVRWADDAMWAVRGDARPAMLFVFAEKRPGDRACQIMQGDFSKIGVQLNQRIVDPSAATSAILGPNNTYQGLNVGPRTRPSSSTH